MVGRLRRLLVLERRLGSRGIEERTGMFFKKDTDKVEPIQAPRFRSSKQQLKNCSKKGKNVQDEGQNRKIVGFDDVKEKVAEDEAFQGRRNVIEDMIVLELGL